MREHNGLYQAIVVSTRDPKGQRRITARVPDVLGEVVSEWARPASIVDAPLKPGAMVWIHFPNGDLRLPVYHVPNDSAHGRVVPDAAGMHVLGPGGAAGTLLNSDVHAQGLNGYVDVYASDFIIVGGGSGAASAARTLAAADPVSISQVINTLQNTVAQLNARVAHLEELLEV
jgi:hypothetical protein